MKNLLILFCLSVILVTSSCSQKDNVCQGDPIISQPVQADDGWQTSSLDSVGINSEKLQMLVKRICDTTYQNIHGILIVKDGKLVFEQYFKGYTFNYEAEECKGTLVKFNRDIMSYDHSIL